MEVKWIIILAVSILVSFVLGVFVGSRRKKIKYDGQLVIGKTEDRDQFQFIFETELEDLKNQKTLTMEIIHSQNLQVV